MESKYSPLMLKNQLCFPVYLCSKEIIRKYTPLLKKLDLTYTQYVVMMYFWERRTSNVKDISRALLLDSGTLTPLLKKLEAKGYITRNRAAKDERNLEVTVTEKGLKLREKALSIPESIAKCINLSEKEAETLYKITHKILANVLNDN
ncbi:MarR family transcriptional regulator [Candidatus Saccharibacteria bacterium]|nr:MarR family transcriptional regulator [Candidatus Saccharibacteria bacterium]